jgi:hypothetical protein
MARRVVVRIRLGFNDADLSSPLVPIAYEVTADQPTRSFDDVGERDLE